MSGRIKISKYILVLFIIFLPITDFKYLAGIVPGSVPLSGIFAIIILFILFFHKLLSVSLAIEREFLPIFQFLFFYTILFISTLFITIVEHRGIEQAFIRYLSYLPAFSYLIIGYYLSSSNKLFFLRLIYSLYMFIIVIELLIFFINANLWWNIRGIILRTNMGDINRFLLFAQEPSFVIYQLLLFIFLHIYLYKNMSMIFALFMIMLVYLTKSLTAVIIFLSFYISYFYYTYFKSNKFYKKILFFISALILALLVANFFIFFIARIENVNKDLSFLIRYYYNLAAFYGFLDSFGIGQGIGQYSVNWIDIFKTHNIPIVAVEVANNFYNQNYHLRPYSVILGILSEGGIIGFFSIMYLLFNIRQNKLGRVFFIPIFLCLFNAYSPAQPYVWLVIGCLIGLNKFSLNSK